MSTKSIKAISGRALVLRGNEIDTDRIIPARFLKCVVFDGLEKGLFFDERKQLKEQKKTHPFDQKRFQGTSILLVNKNFGCGSSREHAPQAIKRWGINSIIGESYSEIFFGNNVALGIPCLTATKEDIEALMKYIEDQPQNEIMIDLNELKVYNQDISIPIKFPESIRQQFLQGTWDTTTELLEASQDIKQVAEKLPYFN